MADEGPRVAAIVLGAGRASRMGGEKLLVPYRGEPLVLHTLRKLAGFDEVLLVVQPGVRPPDVSCRLVENPRWDQGMATSLQAGMEAADADVCLVFLADMPEIPAGVGRALVQAHRRTGKPIVVPTCDGRRGHPVLLAKSLLPEISSLTGDVGARRLLDEHPELIERIAFDDPGILFDVDTPEDLL